jgi:hypothetical protein
MSSAPLNLSYEIVLETLGIRPISHFSNSRESLSPQERLKQVQYQARTFVEDLKMVNQQVQYLQVFDLVSVPYAVKSAFGKATTLLNPYLYVTHRFVVMQFETHAGNKTLLFSPSNSKNKKPLAKASALSGLRIKGLRINSLRASAKQLLKPWLTPRHNTVESALKSVGIPPEKIDFICYSNLQNQDLRKWLGSHEQDAYFPNAKLLVMHQEWEAIKDLLPLQSQNYHPDGVDGIESNKIIPLHSSIMLGDSVALVQTPGKTQGNQSLVVNTDHGISVFSHNGIAVDNYSPEYSTIYGLADYSAETNMAVIPNGRAPELSLDQYISMILEKTIADRNHGDIRFNNVIPVAELSARWQPFALSPTLSFGEMRQGEPSLITTKSTQPYDQYVKENSLAD